MSPKGMDNRNLPQLLDVNYAQNIVNYWISGSGQLIKRKGLESLFASLGTDPITLFAKFTDTYYIYAYGTTLSAYDTSTGASTVIKNDFTGTTFEGEKYGDYFFVTNKTDGLWCVDTSLAIVSYTSYGAPLASQIAVFGSRLLLGDLSTDDTAVFYTGTDDGTNPPFGNVTFFTEGTLMTGAGSIYYRNGGQVTSITSLGETINVFGKEGKWGFQIVPENLSGVYYKTDETIYSRQDFGGGRGAITTPVGLIYVNNLGVWQMSSVGTDNVPFSDQEDNISYLLGNDYFDNLDISNASIIYDPQRGYLYISAAEDSSMNNVVLAMNMKLKGYPISKFTGMNISRFFSDDGTLYASSSIGTVLYKAFAGDSDDGFPVGTNYKQELNIGSLQTRKILQGLYVQGFLSKSSVINVKFDIYDVNGVPITDKIKFQWTTQYDLHGADGWDSASWDVSSWDGDSDTADLIESFDGARPTIRNLQRIILHVTCSDALPHVLNWVGIQTKEKVQIRRRKLIEV